MTVAGLWVEYAHWSPDGRSLLIGAAGRGADLSGFQGGYTFQTIDPSLPDWAPQVDIGIDDSQWRSLWICDVASSTLRCLTPQGVNPWEACWAGDGLVACIASDGPHENHWYKASIRVIDVASGDVRIGLHAQGPDRLAFILAQRRAACFCRGILQRPDCRRPAICLSSR